MAPSSDPNTTYDVYTGLWTDWSEGRVLGATLTLRHQDGTLLIAFIALYVGIVTTRLWRMICFVIHLLYSTNSARDGLHHQRQALLRNAPSPDSTLVSSINLILSWRRQPSCRTWRRIIPIAALSVICTCLFALATGFSSRVSPANRSEVLFNNDFCGYVERNRSANFNLTTAVRLVSRVVVEELVLADAYARNCYKEESGVSSVGCGTFHHKEQLLPKIVNTSSGCPFEPNVCLNGNTNLLLDTGYLDSHDDFGRNAPKDKRFQYRRVVQCAPLKTDGYKSYQVNEENHTQIIRYHYGSSLDSHNEVYGNFTQEFHTDLIYSPKIEDLEANRGDTSQDYSIHFDHVEPSNGKIDPKTASFYPIPELTRTDGDLYLYYLTSYGVIFFDAVFDPWYKVEQSQGTFSSETPLYRQKDPGSPLACFEQHQLCFFSSSSEKDENEKLCTPLLSSTDIFNFPQVIADTLKLHTSNDSSKQGTDQDIEDRLQGLLWILTSTIWSTPRTLHPVAGLGVHALKSRIGLNGGHMGPLPDNQWQLDVQHWHATAIAALQSRFANSAIGLIRSHPNVEPLFRFASAPAEKQLCNQKTHAADYISFSLFGIGITLVIGGLIILLSFMTQPILAWHTSQSSSRRKWRRRRRQDQETSQVPRSCSHTYSHYEWVSNETLQLQRLANEGLGIGTCSGAMKTIPLTKPREALGVLEFSDNPDHPKLRLPGLMSGDASTDLELGNLA